MIVTVGSINMDLVVKVSTYPDAGETVLGSDYELHHGGKGANQAVAAAKLEHAVRFVGALGNDDFAKQLLSGLQQVSIDVTHVKQTRGPSGVAFISVDANGQNRIIVSPGANKHVQADDLNLAMFTDASVALLQLEIPLATVKRAAKLAKQAGATVVLNAAPAQQLHKDDLADVDVLIVNEIEAGMLLGKARAQNISEAQGYARELLAFVPQVVVTMGALGVVWKTADAHGQLDVHAVTVVDSTAAGDAFVGALSVAVAEGQQLEDAVQVANAAGALAVTKAGAQPSLPSRDELKAFLKEIPA